MKLAECGRPEVSVIVPVFNGEKYIERCIVSILRQTISNIEVIIIDDGSTDSTASLCDDFQSKDNRIKVIHKDNLGLSHSRNVGLKFATGKYIGFVDADDWIAPEMYEELYNLAENNDAELCTARYVVTKSERDTFKQLDCSVETLVGMDKLRKYLEFGIADRSNLYSACTKLYRKSLFTDIVFPENQRFEDMATNYLLINKANKFVIYNKKLYYYFMNSTGITRNKCKFNDLDMIKASKEIYEYTKGTSIENLGEIVYGRSYFSILTKCAVYGVDDSIDKKEEFINTIYENYCKYFYKLMKSSMPNNRKVFMPVLRISPKCIGWAAELVRRIKR